jgi:hypothetical protein
MYFLKCYPLTQEACDESCAAAGGRADGVIDPKTWKKYVWTGVYSIADLEAEVVSNILFYLYALHHVSNISFLDHIS